MNLIQSFYFWLIRIIYNLEKYSNGIKSIANSERRSQVLIIGKQFLRFSFFPSSNVIIIIRRLFEFHKNRHLSAIHQKLFFLHEMEKCGMKKKKKRNAW